MIEAVPVFSQHSNEITNSIAPDSRCGHFMEHETNSEVLQEWGWLTRATADMGICTLSDLVQSPDVSNTYFRRFCVHFYEAPEVPRAPLWWDGEGAASGDSS
jgi:hypothetical protein